MNVSLLNDGGQRLLGQAARFEEARKIGALAQLRDAQLDRAGARLPIAVAIAVALSEPLRRTLAVGGAGLGANLQLHQSLGREADHLAQNIGVGGLLHERAKVHHLVGHRSVPRLRCESQTDPTGESSMTAARRTLSTARRKARFASGVLPSCYTTFRDTTPIARLRGAEYAGCKEWAALAADPKRRC